ncbi:ankyrin repeat protein [Colletotrichum asianum]|uniref:Ankyrin repeat protein n=1 Tax=Colletotrichum asianum TaxID=702518 RepID=A0A8H3ZKT1_9PEZI|nr:ankyrin repeat protein [Colletotrichum asianum]
MSLIEEGAQIEEADTFIVQANLDKLPLHLYVRGCEAEIQEFLEFLNNRADQSPAFHQMIAVLWVHAVAHNFAFTLDPTMIDTKISLTTDELGDHAIAAVIAANIMVLKRIIYDPRFNATTFVHDDGNSLLHIALYGRGKANTDSLEVIVLLLDAELDITMINREGMDPLRCWDWQADDMENPTAQELELFDEAAHLFADHGARCDIQGPDNQTALHIHIDQPVRLQLLLENGICVHERIDGTSALESLVLHMTDDLKVLSWELERWCRMLDLVLGYSDKARLNEAMPDGSGLSLIHLPTTWDVTWIVKSLVNHGADPNLRVSVEPYRPASVYHLVEHRPDHAKAMFNNGADPTLTDDYGCDTALVAAFRGGVSVLSDVYSDIKYGVKKDWHDKMDWRRKCEVRLILGEDWLSCTGATALHLGATSLSTEVLRFYIDLQLIVDLDVRSNEGHTPLHFAASARSVSNIEYLSARGCDVNARAKDGSSALHIAARINDVKSARALIKAGCRSSIDLAGMTPAIYAFQASNRELSALLGSIQLDSGSVSSDSPEQQTADYRGRPRDKSLALAFRNVVEMNNLALCQSLHANGCNFTTSLNDCAGGSLISEAIALKRITIVEWMLQQGVSMTTAVVQPVESAIHRVLKDADFVSILSASLENYAENGGRLLGETPNIANTVALGNNIKGLEILLQHAEKNKGYYGMLWSMRPDKVVSALVNEFDLSTGWTPLHEAADCGSLEAVQILLQSGADIDALDPERFQTPLHVAICSDHDMEEVVALYLIQEGADLEQRDAWGDTPAIDAAKYKRTRTLSALISAKSDINATDSYHRTLLHLLVIEGSVMAFADLVHRGADLYRGDAAGYSAFHRAIEHTSFISFLLNSDLRLEDATSVSMDAASRSQMAWLTTAYPLFRKRYGLRALGQFANLTPTGSQAPLCEAVKQGSVLAMKNLLDCSSGSALMAACEVGRKDFVKYLVRRGASLSYTGSNGFRSAYKSAKGHEEILKWLLVDRFTDQQKMTVGLDSNPRDEMDRGPFFWSGPIKAELVISGQMERLPHESSREYWSWLMKEKVQCGGEVLPPSTRRRTASPSNIVPQETVRIHPQGYNSNGHEEDWFSKKMPQIQYDGRCWYMSYIDTP